MYNYVVSLINVLIKKTEKIQLNITLVHVLKITRVPIVAIAIVN
jgi:hypothetical protein